MIQAGNDREYRLAQLDDQAGRRRGSFIWHPPIALSVRARVSSASIPGTWGFGLWNDPFGFGCSPATETWQVPAPPQAAWFFSASPMSYLSFREDSPANGFFAQVLRSPKAGIWLVPIAMSLPFAARSARRTLSRRILEDAAGVAPDPSAWHRYEIRWQHQSTQFSIDEHVLLETRVSPRAPLALVIWIDNQYAAFDPGGRFARGVERNQEEAWLEVEALSCEPGL
jgi:hypothetical protein